MLEPKARKILVIKFRHIGDVLLTAPLISTLKHAHPGNHISAAVKPGTEAMLEGHPDLDQLYILPQIEAEESKLHFFSRYLQWLWQLRKERFDIAINTTEGDRGILLSYLAGAKIRVGILKNKNEKWWRRWIVTYPSLPLSGRHHTVTRNLALANLITNSYHYEVKLHFSEEDQNVVRQLLIEEGWKEGQNLIHIHPTSRWLFKCWEDEYMAEVIDWVETNGYRVALTAAPIDTELLRAANIIQYCKHPPIQLAGKLTLKQLASLSSISMLFFGVDSAPMHIAASTNTPTIALFGPSGGFDWGPWPNNWSHDDNPYPNQNGIQHTDNHIVIQQPWECAPCGQDGCEGSKKSRCLDELTPERVIPIIRQQIDRVANG